MLEICLFILIFLWFDLFTYYCSYLRNAKYGLILTYMYIIPHIYPDGAIQSYPCKTISFLIWKYVLIRLNGFKKVGSKLFCISFIVHSWCQLHNEFYTWRCTSIACNENSQHGLIGCFWPCNSCVCLISCNGFTICLLYVSPFWEHQQIDGVMQKICNSILSNLITSLLH